ncbi:hypothetical protein LEP1GSC072_2305 [Leptospira noguchii str. Bonito]|nr:hypothetical protein LEP1GSC072_2305 [Leptospira noguchii str. Bonito]
MKLFAKPTLTKFVNANWISEIFARFQVRFVRSHPCDDSSGSVLNSFLDFGLKLLFHCFEESAQLMLYDLINGFQSFCSLSLARLSR